MPVYAQFGIDVETGEPVADPHVEMAGPHGERRVYDSRLVPIETVAHGRAVLGIAMDVTDREVA